MPISFWNVLRRWQARWLKAGWNLFDGSALHEGLVSNRSVFHARLSKVHRLKSALANNSEFELSSYAYTHVESIVKSMIGTCLIQMTSSNSPDFVIALTSCASPMSPSQHVDAEADFVVIKLFVFQCLDVDNCFQSMSSDLAMFVDLRCNQHVRHKYVKPHKSNCPHQSSAYRIASFPACNRNHNHKMFFIPHFTLYFFSLFTLPAAHPSHSHPSASSYTYLP